MHTGCGWRGLHLRPGQKLLLCCLGSTRFLEFVQYKPRQCMGLERRPIATLRQTLLGRGRLHCRCPALYPTTRHTAGSERRRHVLESTISSHPLVGYAADNFFVGCAIALRDLSSWPFAPHAWGCRKPRSVHLFPSCPRA